MVIPRSFRRESICAEVGLFVPSVAGQEYEWYRECSKIMTVQEFVEAAEAEEEPCPTALRHDE